MIISGQLLNKVGGPIQWATITFDPSNGEAISFQTDFEGKYSQDIPVGSYRVYKKEKYNIDIELLGENVAVDATGTLDLESLIDRNTTPSYTAETLPDPATLAAGATVIVDGDRVESTGTYIRRVDKPFLYHPISTRNAMPITTQALASLTRGYRTRRPIFVRTPIQKVVFVFANKWAAQNG